jgi:ABC-type multidrug transport system fused ATPase/permease subunit
LKKETYYAYLENVGHYTIGITLVALAGIMVFQQAVDLWIVYWSAKHREAHFLTPYVVSAFGKIPEGNQWMLWVYGGLLALFTASTFAGHICEIVGGIRAAAAFFKEALIGTLNRPFRWWDTTPTGRVLNRFSEDVEVMDNSITNILGVIFGAMLYFVGHVSFLALANKWSLLLLPVIIVLLECIAKYYRRTIREVHRLYLVSMSTVYQGMVETIMSGATVRAYAASQRVVCQSLLGLDDYMRISLVKSVINSWVGLRMGLVGYALSVATTLYPVLQYFGLVAAREAGLIAFSITYSSGISGIIQQFIMNFSDLEMQLVSIERLREYSVRMDQGKMRGSPLPRTPRTGDNRPKADVCLELRNVSVTYRDGLKPALQCISLSFATGKSCAIVGRTGAGKSSLLLSVLQLVPYSGYISIDGQLLGQMDPHDVRKKLVGVVPQHPVIFEGTLRWNLDPDGAASSMELWCALEAVGLLRMIRECEDERGLDVPVGTPGGLLLSQGQKQLLCAARTLLREPRVALLDEISASLPASSAKYTTSALLTRFKENEAAVLLVTHQTEIAAACDRTVTISNGRVVN